MKRIILIAGIVIATFVSNAQSNAEDIELIQSLYGKNKKEIVAGFVKLTDAQKEPFWKLYDEYEVKRKELGKRRIALIEKYASIYDSLTDQRIETVMKEMFSLQKQTDNLIETYYHKMKKPAGYMAAGQFSQVEGYLLSIVRVTILENIPFFGELYIEKK